MKGIRRVVTGRDHNGKSVFTSDAEVAPVTFSTAPGGGFHLLWSADELPTFPSDGIDPYDKGFARQFFPAHGGFRFNIFTLPPHGSGADLADMDPQAVNDEADEKLPGILSANDPDDPGMHATETIDLEIVVSGEVTLELDDGAERTMRAGDTVIQCGTRHRWHNRGSEPAVLAAVLIGGGRAT
jgi:mannose-6-phosphate isomerase-like protein (cupin superfamily)